jgi:hypothetical protein
VSQDPIKALVLRAITDDYESFDIILECVAEWAAGLEITAHSRTVKGALEELINEDYAQAYLLSSSPPAQAQPVPYDQHSIDDLWFCVTSKGKKMAHEMRDKWSSDTG